MAQSSLPKAAGQGSDEEEDDGLDMGAVLGRWGKSKATRPTSTDQQAGPSRQQDPLSGSKGRKGAA